MITMLIALATATATAGPLEQMLAICHDYVRDVGKELEATNGLVGPSLVSKEAMRRYLDRGKRFQREMQQNLLERGHSAHLSGNQIDDLQKICGAMAISYHNGILDQLGRTPIYLPGK